jgi:hypothetical protein
MPFDGLPAELKLSIAEHLDPISSFSFAIASRLNWVVCEPVVRKHAWLYQEYKTIDACHAGTLLWNTLKAILKDPSLGWYVRELNVPGSRQYDWNEDGERGSGNLPPNNYEAFEEATQELYAIYLHQVNLKKTSLVVPCYPWSMAPTKPSLRFLSITFQCLKPYVSPTLQWAVAASK